MKKNKTKHSTYLRIFSSFLAIYLILMIGFSVYLVFQQKKMAEMDLRSYALQVSAKFEDILKENMDSENHIKDITLLRKEIANELNSFTTELTEIAIFTGEYKLIFNTTNYWKVSYSNNDVKKFSTEYGFINPKDWYSEENIKDIERYLYAQPKAKKEGDLSGYLVDVKGFWVDNENIIPEQISVTEMYAQKFDENGDVSASGGIPDTYTDYRSNHKNIEGLPYFEFASVIPENTGNPNNEKQNELRQLVIDSEYLKETLSHIMLTKPLSQRVDLLNYRFYQLQPYPTAFYDGQDLISDFWFVFGRDVNLWEQCSNTLVFVWISCFIIFMIVAFILSRQTYNTYQKRENLDRQRKEMTKALAHDLKTPLSIISGYAQNLQENIFTEKRGHYVKHIQANIDRMDRIIREMLELTTLESDSLKITIKDFPLNELCNEILIRYKHVCAERRITTILQGEAYIKADRSLIGRVIDNFFINAIENMPEAGEIRITISDNTLEIFNSGSHIPEEKIDEIWLPFKKGEASRGNTKGTGLGLSISRSILELLKFQYGARNCEDGVIFWFKFR
ncbi:HAMP domain-containing sensor histidine kinase [Lysinibacillus boronitolerans]|uniref:sensor histidine kinase n=1 Tax=Lysinibacillus TaxID=400634 RepID=UPI002161690C|nr:HAMP domain-containing sensor histidine kinase [Lysinibacillus boronitolerans]MCS1390264.1 HAMP domain-containing histidine kinase [Lysinibacillus boronitolerans]